MEKECTTLDTDWLNAESSCHFKTNGLRGRLENHYYTVHTIGTAITLFVKADARQTPIVHVRAAGFLTA